MKLKTAVQKRYLIAAAVLSLCVVGVIYYYLFAEMSTSDDVEYIYIDTDDTADSIIAKLKPMSHTAPLHSLRTIMRHTGYDKDVRTGRYAIRPSEGALMVYRHLSRGLQTSLQLTIPSVRTVEDLSGKLGEKLMLDSLDILDALTDPEVCKKYDLDTCTMISLFIPNTYDIYWNVSLENLLGRMQKESDRFWQGDRMSKAKKLGLTPAQVMTVASIVDEETANGAEKPMVAGMYLNRLKANMPLQADPTIKFALKEFGLRRIYRKLLDVDSPYNTYRNAGLPPGPIRVASVQGIDAVLNAVKHDYMYMCAKEDFSGTHNFAVTYAEHLKNAARYAKALNERGVR